MKTIILFGFLICTANLYAQSCLPGVTLFKNQQQIDAFPSDYPGCMLEIEGNIWILEDSAGAITNLDSFYPIQRINGYFANC